MIKYSLCNCPIPSGALFCITNEDWTECLADEHLHEIMKLQRAAAAAALLGLGENIEFVRANARGS